MYCCSLDGHLVSVKAGAALGHRVMRTAVAQLQIEEMVKERAREIARKLAVMGNSTTLRTS